jgi:hypothetical protein
MATTKYKQFLNEYRISDVRYTNKKEQRVKYDFQFDPIHYPNDLVRSADNIRTETVNVVQLSIAEDDLVKMNDNFETAKEMMTFFRQRPDLAYEFDKWKTWTAISK